MRWRKRSVGGGDGTAVLRPVRCRPARQWWTLWGAFFSIAFLAGADASLQAESPGKSAPLKSKDFGRKLNHLAHETNPYLRMHAENPVDWYPWGPEALQKAMEENKPIFLSVGYSTCFWCHVMERQVFENEEIAAYMNEHFVSIKVDREARPDIDDVYMTALQVYFQLARSSQGGGWPLSLFLTPEGKPIAGGTYFPPDDQPGQTSFPKVLRQIQNAWKTREADVRATAEILTRETVRLTRPPVVTETVELKSSLVEQAVRAVMDAYDPQYGGFDFRPDSPEGPKFPVPSRLELLQAQVGRPKFTDKDPAMMLDQTLTHMAAGGIWDHLGGGFHRYSTDRRWHVPHFEKMLYDNAQLAEVYVEAYRRTGRESFRDVAEGVFAFVAEELTGPRGEFYSALDAETKGVEGAYYVWSQAELSGILNAGDFRVLSAVYTTDQPTEFEPGLVLHRDQPLEQIAGKLGMPVRELELRIQEIEARLLAVRRQRPALIRDEKVLTAWNGLMIRAYARAGQVLKRRDYLDAAEKAAVGLLTTHRTASGELLRTAATPQSQQPAFLDDYAFLISGLLAMYEATGEDKWLSTARRLTDEQIRQFWDPQLGGFFTTANDQEVVLARLKDAGDQVLPSGNSVSAQNLVRLARWKSEETYRKYAEQTLMAFSSQLKEDPGRFPYLALSLQEYLHWYGTQELKAAGDGLFMGGLSTPRERPATPAVTGPAIPAGTPGHSSAMLEFPHQPAVIPAFLPAADRSKQHAHLQARGLVSVDPLVRGGECQVAVEVVIAKDWHLNANPPHPEFVIPVQLQLKDLPGFALKEVQYPAGEELHLKGVEEALHVYTDRAVMTGTLSIPKDAAELVELEFLLDYQVCNHEQCLRKQRLVLKGKVATTNDAAISKTVNQEFFQSLRP